MNYLECSFRVFTVCESVLGFLFLFRKELYENGTCFGDPEILECRWKRDVSGFTKEEW